MLDGAYVEICGNLKKDLVIKETKTGRKYGILSVAVEKRISLKSKANQSNYKTHNYPVYIWDQTLLENQGSSYKKGERVLVIGELDVVKNKKSPSLSDETAGSQQAKSRMIINIKKNIGISILPQDMASLKTQDNINASLLPKEDHQQSIQRKLQSRTLPKDKASCRRKRIIFFPETKIPFLRQES
jgi:single-stranded DNA-binding protein